MKPFILCYESLVRLSLSIVGALALYYTNAPESLQRVWQGAAGLFVLDAIMGVSLAIRRHSFKSTIFASKGLRKLFGYAVILTLGTIIDHLLGQAYFYATLAGFYVAFGEFSSVLENANKLGIPLPGPMRKVGEVLRQRSEGINDWGDPRLQRPNEIEEEYDGNDLSSRGSE